MSHRGVTMDEWEVKGEEGRSGTEGGERIDGEYGSEEQWEGGTAGEKTSPVG